MLSTFLAIGCGTIGTQAALVGPSWPAPGGTTFTSSGVSPGDGIRTWSYSEFDTAAFSELYWGPAGAVFSRLSGSGPGSTMTFSGISGGGTVAYWTGTAYYLDNSLQQRTAPTLFRATANNSMSWILGSSVGLPAVGAVVDNTAGVDFNVNLEFLVWNGYSYMPLNAFGNLYDHGSASPNTQTSFSGGFYSAAPVPEPSTYVAGALLLLPFLVTTVRRFHQRRVG